MTIKELKPELIWGIFDRITKVPRPSKKEEKIRQFLLDFAKEHNISVKTDEVGNVVMSKPATPGKENAPTVILQGHMDMVCESNDKNFDFDNNPITTIIDGEWVHADGTTLGADNGIGMAASLAVMVDDSLVHGPVEALFTVDEETGMTGANNLGKDMMNGSILLNLDSEDDGEIFIGCAGGVDTTITFDYKREMAPADNHWFKIDLSNLSGGHSGGDIHEGRANSNKLLARFLFNLSLKHVVKLSEISGGNLRNAIPRAAHAVFGVSSESKEKVMVAFNEYVAAVEKEYAHTDPNMTITIESVEKPEYAIDTDTSDRLIRSLYACPHGVISMSHDLEGLVETSTNLAAVKMQDNSTILITTSQRSSVESRKWDIARQIEALFVLAGAHVTHGDGYPGWAPDMNSTIMKIASDAYEELYNVKPAIKAIHAGLECGLFLTKYPHLDMVSFGPTLRGVHSPSEKMHIPAVEKFWNQLTLILKKVADLKK
ncbi:aminoacyl-histidine dipeptidase [Barnesiella sp. WM24]|uniref:aminoacyl-histidine dipeptidase n=1 Tax=Barnesiella sp. WM24 TaxID=2558278 RepID=UPI0010727C5C|nr:aminoacyl-histidine dipeptidase [Barnesiella sp. WM24]TFU94797.1 aminoacyl-histidine dipeptidase [Barnesiella sp. WM24]